MSWGNVLFTDVVSDVTSGNAKIKQKEYLVEGPLPVIDQGKGFIGGYVDDISLACKEKLPVVIFGDHTREVKFVDQPFALGADGVKVLKPSSDALDEKYLYYFLKQARLPEDAGYSRHFKFIKRLEIPLPPLEEQKRIAGLLDKADAIRRKHQQAIDLTDQLLRSAFLDMFGDPVTNLKGWEIVNFESVGQLDRGKSKHRPRNDPILLGGDHPLIQTGDVANSGGYITKHKSTYSDIGLNQSRKWPAGTLCITIAANIANTGILEFDACFPDSVVGFTPNEFVTVEYVQAWLGFLQKIIEDAAPESAQKNINLAILRELKIPLPDIEEQKKFSEIVHSIKNTKAKLVNGDNEIQNLFDSLTQQAFSGELSKQTEAA